MELPYHCNLYERKREAWVCRTPQELKHLAYIAFVRSGVEYGILILSKTVMQWREHRGGLHAVSQISMIGLQVLLRYYINSISNPLKND